MQNLKWGGIASVFAIIVSVGLGLAADVSMFHIVIRAITFSVIFFGLGFGLKFIINSYFPELLYMEDEHAEPEDNNEQPGSKINITIDNMGEYAVPELYKAPNANEELGNIEDLVSGVFKVRVSSPQAGIDRKREEGYNVGGFGGVSNQDTVNFNDMFNDTGGLDNSSEQRAVFSPSLGDETDGLGGLPDLDAMAMAFSPAGDSFERPSARSGGGSALDSALFSSPETDEPERQSQYNTGNKSQPLQGDFNPKELAEGIRTVLSKDK